MTIQRQIHQAISSSTRALPGCIFLLLLLLTGSAAFAKTNTIGSADGSFETDLSGTTVTGDPAIVTRLGTLLPTEGVQSLLMSTQPDSGSTPADADVSTLKFGDFSIGAEYATLRLDYNFLTNEPDPSFANDAFTVTLVLVTAGGESVELSSDTFGSFQPSVWSGYSLQTGFRSMVADVSAYAGSSDLVSLVLRIEDLGDGRRDSAVLVDDVRLVEPGVPQALVADNYFKINPGEAIIVDGSGSSDDVGILTYEWVFGNGFGGFGPNVLMDQYTDDGFYQGSLTVTDGDGFTDTATFTVAVGDSNSAPVITSLPNSNAASGVPYSYQVTVVDAEIQFGDIMNYTLTEAPAGMTIDALSGLVSWVPPAGLANVTPVTVGVTDSMGLSDSQSFNITRGPEDYIATMSDDSRLYTASSRGDGSWGPLQFVQDIGTSSRGVTIGDFNSDGDFDVVTGYGSTSPTIHLYYFERNGTSFETPVYIGPVGNSTNTAGTYPEDMAAEDFNKDGRLDFIINGDSAYSWYAENTGALVTEPENFFASDFETGNEGWGGALTSTSLARDDTTSASGTWSMRVFATGTPTSLSVDINPTNWFLSRGSTVRFDYRIPTGVPTGLLFNVSGRGWIWLGGTPAGDPGTVPVAPGAVTLIDDDAWHSVEINVNELIRELWPDASQVTEFEWWTNNNAVAGQQFWFDDFRITRPRMVSGFDISLLPSTGGNSRGIDAADVNGDGNMDFARARTSSGYIYLYTGDGEGNFTPSTAQVADPGNDPYGVLLKDFDNDGVVDLIGNNNGSGDTRFFRGNGDGTFAAGVLIGSLDTNNYTSLGAYDFNNDGNMDVVASTYTFRQVWYYPGNGDGTFAARTLIGSTTSPAANILSIAAPAGRVAGQPFALATQDQIVVNEGETINFDATESYDDGTIVDYAWDFDDGGSANGVTVTHDFLIEGNYTVVLTVTDDDGLRDRASLNVTVLGDAPVAVTGDYAQDESDALLGRWEVPQDGSASSDSDTSIVSYQWDFDASDGIGIDATGATPVAAYTAPGSYTVTLTVIDEVGLTDTDTGIVTITAGAPPVPDLTGPATLDEADASLGDWTGWYNTSGSNDDEGIASYTIDWGDGSSGSTLAPLADNFSDGNYTANPVWNVSGGTWSVSNGVLNQTNLGGAWRFLQDLNRSYRDFELQLDFMGVDTGTNDGYIGIVFRNSNTAGSTNSLLMYSRNSWDYWRFYDWRTNTTLQDGGTGWDEGIWYHLRIRVVGDSMELYVTPEGGVEALQIQTTRAGFPSGGIGVLANTQALQYDNIRVTPLDFEWLNNGFSPGDLGHTFDVAGTYPVTLTVTDHAGQSVSEVLNTVVSAGAPPVADTGGPYTLDENDAFGGQWNLIVDASASTDDTHIERYSVNFGDGISYTTGFADGSRGSYFATGTDLYGYDTAGADLRRIIGTENNTSVEIINLATNAVIDSTTVNRLGAWDPAGSPPGDGIAYKVKASKPVVAYFTNFGNHSTFVPSMDGDPVGKEFIFYMDENQGFNVYAFENAIVKFFNNSGTLVAQRTVSAGDYWPVSVILNNADYRVVSTGRISMQTAGNNGFTSVPSDTGDGAGRQFYFATRDGTTESIVAFAHEAADVEVFDLDSGASLYSASIAAGDMWYQTGVGTRRLRLDSTADVEVWAGDTEGSTAITSLGDDISFAGGRGGTEFVLHTLNEGVVIFAPNDNTNVDIDSGGLTATLQRDEFLRLTPSDFPGGTGVHNIVTSEPVIIQTLGKANTFNDLGSYLGGVSMRHRYAATGNYTLTVTTTDNAGQSDTATTSVEVLATAPPIPVIDAPSVADESFAVGGQWSVEFDASGSTDDVGIFSYGWDFGDGGTATGILPTHVYSASGTYTVTLTVTDHAGQSKQITHDIDVTFGDGPTADAGGPYLFGEESASEGVWTATFDGSGSTDDSGIFDYVWKFDPLLSEDFSTALDSTVWTADGGASVQAGRLVIPGGGWANTGHYSVQTFDRTAGQVQVTGEVFTPTSGSAMWGVFKASPANFSYTQMPHALYFANGSLQVYENGAYRGNFGSYVRGSAYEVRLDVLSSGANYYYRDAGATDWTLLYSGPASTSSPLRVGASVNSGAFGFDNYSIEQRLYGPVVTREFTAPTVENVMLSVRDNALQEDSDTTTITIETGAPPVADAGGPYTVEVGSMNLFNGTGSTDDVNIEHYNWVFGDSTGGASDLPYVGKGATVTHFYQAVGTYDLSLTVSDNTGQTDTDTTTVEVIVGSPPVASIGVPTDTATNGPPAYFDALSTADDYGVVEYRWDFDDRVDRDGDGNFTNDIDAVGARPFHAYPSATGLFLDEKFEGNVLDTNAWLAVGATQDELVSISGAGSWGSRYLFSSETYSRGATYTASITPVNASGNQHAMIGLKDTNTSFNYTRMPHAIYFNNGNINIYEQGSYRGVFGTYTRGLTYEVRIDVKPGAGAIYYFREQGAATWSKLYESTNRTDTPLRFGITVHSGEFELDNFAGQGLDPYKVTLTVEDGAGQTDTATVTVPVAVNLPPDVVTVPWVARDPVVPHETFDGRDIALKGIVRDADPVTYQWDFGDGTQSAVLNVTNPFDLGIVHTYPDAPAGTPFTAILKVWDSQGQMGQDNYNVIVRPQTLNTEINIAIDEGLWYLHKQQTRTTADGYDTGYWTSNARASATASAIQAFEINGHTENVDHAEVPYAETVMRGLRQLFRDLGTVNIGVQTYGEPDTDGNNIGIQTGVNGSGGQPIYQGGQVMDAIASSGSPLTRTITGADGIKRRSYFDILTDMSDQFAWGQTEQGNGGAWRYGWNNSIDNSAAQWGAIGMLASEDVFGIPVPPWVKERNRVWLDRSYSGTGWGYTSGTSRAGTPSGMVQWIFSEGNTSDGEWQTAEKWMADTWTSQYIINPGNRPYYPYFAMTKAMRLAEPEPVVNFESNNFDWFNDPVLGLARTLVDDQLSSPVRGEFPGFEWITDQLRSAWGVIILSQTLFVQPPVADAGRDRAWAVDRPLPFDASGSFHLDPFRSIVQYEWDFDGDGTFDLTTTNPIAEHTYSSSDYPESTLPQTFTVTLRVTDDQTPALTDTDTVNIIIAVPPHPPVAEAGGPYTCSAGVPCQLDGSGSFDIDPFDKIVRWEWELDATFPFDFDEASGETPLAVFLNEGVFDIGLRVWDDGQFNDIDNDGEVDENERLSDQHFVKVTVVENLAPFAEANGPYTLNEGSTINLDATGSSDPNNDLLIYQWDYNDDGLFDDATGATPEFTGIDDAILPVAVRVSDSLLTDIASSTIIVQNVAPSVDAGPDINVPEGTSVVFNGAFTDPGTLDTHVITWDFGDGTPAVTGTLSPAHVYPDDGVFVVTLTVVDDDGGVGSDTLTVVVGNVIPVVDAGPDVTIDEGDTFVSAGSFSDPGADSWTATVDYGDGSGIQPLTLNLDGSFDLGKQYVDDGLYTVIVTVTDDDGGVGTDTAIVTVNNVPPVVEAGADQSNVLLGTLISLDPATFTDAGVIDTHSAEIDWGDGTVEPGILTQGAGNGSVDGTHSYATAGNYVVTVTVTDNGAASGSDSMAVEIVATPNTPPTVDAGPDATIDEGDTFSSTGSFTDPDTDTWTATVDYGEGAGPQPLALNPDNTFALDNLYEEDGVYTVTVSVNDGAGGTGIDSAIVTVNNVPPVVDAGPDAIINEGDTFVSAGSFTDPGADSWTATVNYGDGSGVQPLALNPDGSFDLGNLYVDDGLYTVTVTVSDDDGGVGVDTALVTVNNVPPAVDAGPDATINEGDTFVSAGSFIDPGADSWTATVDYGDGSGVQPLALNPDGSFNLGNLYVDDGLYTVTVTVSDDDGGVGVDSALVTVNNVPPVVDAGADAIINEGDTFVSAGSFTDPGADSWTATVDYGDGSGVQPLALNLDGSFDLGNLYVDDGLYTVTVTVSDDDGGVGVDTALVTVNNVPPAVDAGPDQTVDKGDTVNFSGSFTDPGVADTHTIVWDFGDGNGTSATLTPNHSYVVDGIYTVTLTVTDDDGGVGVGTLTVTVQDNSVQPPEPPIDDLYARAKNSKIDLVWAPNPEATGYNVYRSTTQGGPYDLIAANHQCDYCVYADFGLTNGITYYYVVTWINAAGESAASNEASATPTARTRRR